MSRFQSINRHCVLGTTEIDSVKLDAGLSMDCHVASWTASVGQTHLTSFALIYFSDVQFKVSLASQPFTACREKGLVKK